MRLRVTNEERERLGLKTIKPVDMSDEELALLRKAKIARDPELGKHGDRLFAAAWEQTRDSYTESEFTLAMMKLVHTLRELIAMDKLEAELATAPQVPVVELPVRPRRRKRRPKATAQGRLL